MAQNEYIHVSPKVRAKDHTTLATVRSLPGYSSRDPEFELPKLEAADAALVAANKDFAKLNAAWGPARDKLVAAKWAFHNAMVGARGQVAAQFGANSKEVQAVGLKRKSERKRPGPKPGSKRKPKTPPSAD